MGQLAEHNWSHFDYSPLITRRSAGTILLVTLLLLSNHHPWISWQSTAGHTSVTLPSSPVCQLAEHTGHTSVTLHSTPVCQLAEYSWSHFCYSPLITRGSAGRVQLVTLLLLSTYHPWISWQSTAGHTSVTLQSSPVCQLAEHTGHTSVTLHSTPVCQLAEYSWSHFCYSPLITCGSAGRAQLVTLLLLSSHHPFQLAGHTGHTSVVLHSTPVCQLAEYTWSHFCYSQLITHGSAVKAQLVTILLLSTHHPWISWQITASHTSVTLHSSPVDQLAEYSWSQFCYSPLITRGSAGRVQLVTLLLISSHHPCVSWQSTLVTLRLLSTQQLCVSWQSAACHTSVTLHSSPVDQLADHSWSHFCYSPLITRGSAGRVQLVTLLLLSIYHPCVSWQSTLVTLRLLSTQHPCVSLRSTLGTLLLLSTHHTWVNWQGNPHLVETKTINSYQLKSIFYIFYQIL